MVVSNRNLLFQGPIFRGYVSFREGKSKTHNNSSTLNVQLSELLQKTPSTFLRGVIGILLGGGFKYLFIFPPIYLRKWFNLTDIFQTGWFNRQLIWIQKIVDRSFGYCSPQEFLLKPTWWVWPVFDGHKLDLSKRSAKTWHIPRGQSM